MEPLSFTSALDFISSKVVHADWDADQWLRQEPDIRARAFWLSRVENARFLNRALKDIEDFMRGSIEEFPQEDGTVRRGFKVGGRADFVRRTRESMIKEGMLTEEELDRIKQNSDTDVKELASRSRLKLVFDTNIRSAWGYGHWKQGMQPHVLRRYPAARFIRIPGAKEPRIRHLESEGDIRLKTDNAYWADYQNAKDIGGFEVPWAPYGFHSYMEQEDVSRKGAEAAGLNVSSVVPSKKGLNDGLSAGTKTMDPAIRKRLIEQLKREQVLHKARPSAKELAKKAAQKARLSSIERSLQKAQGRGDAAEVARIQKVLGREQYEQALDTQNHFMVVDKGDVVKLFPADYVEPKEALDSVDQLKQRLEDSAEKFTKKREALEKSLAIYDTRLERVEDLEFFIDANQHERWAKLYKRVEKGRKLRDRAVREAGMGLVELPVSYRGIVNTAKGKRPQRGQKADGLRLFERVVHKDISNNTSIHFKGSPSRSFQNDKGTHGEIHMRSSAPPSVVAHEIMHQAELRHFLEEARGYLSKRAGGEQTKRLRDITPISYGVDEVAYEDEFASRGNNAYAGKLYGKSADRAVATELLTVGLERLMRNPVDFARLDPDYFTWLVKLIQKRP